MAGVARYTRRKARIKSGDCPVCGKHFHHARNKTCSEECKMQLIVKFSEMRKLEHRMRSLNRKTKTAESCPEIDFRERTEFGEPTDAPPGSVAKFEVLKYRASNGLALWHPDDRCDFRGLYCGPGRGDDGHDFSLGLLRAPAVSRPRTKDENGTSVKVGGKHLAE